MIMTPGLMTAHCFITQLCALPRTNQSPYKSLKNPTSSSSSSNFLSKPIPIPIPRFSTVFRRSSTDSQNSHQSPSKTLISNSNNHENSEELQSDWKVEVGNPNVASYVPPAGFSLSDRAFFLLAFIACTTSIGFASLVIAAVPALHAMGRAAISLSKLADTAREELPSTMAAVRLSGMEISDLTLELSDLSQEIADGMKKSAQAVQAAEAGIQQIGSLTRHKTMAMIEERANLPVISVKPVVAGAAKKTSQAVGQATRALLSILSPGEFNSKNETAKAIDRLEI